MTGRRALCQSVVIQGRLFKLSESAQKRWNRLRGFQKLGEVIQGVRFIDGVKPSDKQEPVNQKVAA